MGQVSDRKSSLLHLRKSIHSYFGRRQTFFRDLSAVKKDHSHTQSYSYKMLEKKETLCQPLSLDQRYGCHLQKHYGCG
jgi:hypothetical protein